MVEREILGISILVLLGLNVFQLMYWSRQVQKLIDKLMSRNYAEYENVSRPQVVLPVPEASLIEEPDEDLQQLNGVMAGIN